MACSLGYQEWGALDPQPHQRKSLRKKFQFADWQAAVYGDESRMTGLLCAMQLSSERMVWKHVHVLRMCKTKWPKSMQIYPNDEWLCYVVAVVCFCKEEYWYLKLIQRKSSIFCRFSGFDLNRSSREQGTPEAFLWYGDLTIAGCFQSRCESTNQWSWSLSAREVCFFLGGGFKQQWLWVKRW